MKKIIIIAVFLAALFISVSASSATTRSHVIEHADAVAWWHCMQTPGWKCANSRAPAADCSAIVLHQEWSCIGGMLLYKSGVWNFIKGVFGFHVPHMYCVWTSTYQNYPFKLLGYPGFQCHQY